MEIPSPVVTIRMEHGEITIVLPRVQGITTGFEYVEGQKVPIVRVLTQGEPILVLADSPDAMASIAQSLRSSLSLWHLYASMGPVMYNQVVTDVSTPAEVTKDPDTQ